MTWNRNGNPGAWPLPPAARASRGSGTTVAGGPCLASRCCRQASRVSPELASHQPSGPDAEPRAHAVCTAGLWRPCQPLPRCPTLQLLWTCRLSGRRNCPAHGEKEKARCLLLATAAPTSYSGQRGWKTTQPSSLPPYHETAESRELQQAARCL